MNKERFEQLCLEAATHGRTAGANGFGTLAEKRLHAVIKKYVCADEAFHEVGVAGTRYLSDVRVGNEVFEVQTGSFYPLKKKELYRFLKRMLTDRCFLLIKLSQQKNILLQRNKKGL